jgi:glycosyltransferase involved in cell wall biosynthesis
VLFGVGPRPAGLPPWIEYVRNPTPARLVENVYNGSAIYVCPSESEGWGLPAVEAMACGCALVRTEGGAAPDYAKHGSTAMLSPVGDSNALATNILRLLGDREERVRLARAGNGVVRTFQWGRSIRSFEHHVMSGRGACS